MLHRFEKDNSERFSPGGKTKDAGTPVKLPEDVVANFPDHFDPLKISGNIGRGSCNHKTGLGMLLSKQTKRRQKLRSTLALPIKTHKEDGERIPLHSSIVYWPAFLKV